MGRIRAAVNGHGKKLVGGLGIGAIALWIGEDLYRNASAVPVVAAKLEEHEKLPVHPGAASMIADLSKQVDQLNADQDKRFMDKQANDTAMWIIQAETNRRIETKLDTLIGRSAGKIP